MKEQLLNYTKYNLWANKRICGFMQKLEPELWDKEILSSFNTIRKTAYHVWDAEIIWLTRLNGESLNFWPSSDFKGSNEDFVKGFTEHSAKFITYVESKSNSELELPCNYKSTKGEPFTTLVCDIILHCMNHSTFHRGQLITMLRNAGLTELGSTDYIYFLRDSKSR